MAKYCSPGEIFFALHNAGQNWNVIYERLFFSSLFDSEGKVGIHYSDWEGKGPCAIVPLIWKMAHQSLCRMIRNGPLKISKSLKKAENGPLAKISSLSLTLQFLDD